MQLVGFPALQSLNAQTATTTVPVALDNGICKGSHAVYVVAGTGVSAGVVALQVSADGQNWSNPGASAVAITLTTPGTFALAVANFPAQFVRAAITTTVTGGTASAWVGSA